MGGSQSVISHILIHATLRVVVKSIDNRLCGRHTPPNSGIHINHSSTCRQTILERFATIAKNILADITEVEIEFTSMVIRILNKGVHQPELNGLNVLGFKIGIIQFAHDTTPTTGWIDQQSAVGNTSAESRRIHVIVIRSLLGRIIGQIQLIDIGRLSRHSVLVGEHLLFIDSSRIGFRQIIEGNIAGSCTCLIEVITDAVPSQLGAVLAIAESAPRSRLREHSHRRPIILRRARKEP